MKARQRKKHNDFSRVTRMQNIRDLKKIGIKRPRQYLNISGGPTIRTTTRLWALRFGMSTQGAGRSVYKAVMKMGQAFKSFGRNRNADNK